MNRFKGSTLTTVLLGVAGLVGLGAGGYSLITGQTLCSMFASCSTTQATAVSAEGEACPISGDRKKELMAGGESCPLTGATIVEASAESSKADSCCPLSGKAEPVVAMAAVEGEACEKTASCDEGEARVVNAAVESGCEKASVCEKGETNVVAAAVEGECNKTSTCDKTETVAFNASLKGDACEKTSTCDKSGASVIAAAVEGETCEKAASCDKASVVNAAAEGECNKAASCDESKAGVVNAAIEGESCDKASACIKSAPAEAVAAVNASWTVGFGLAPMAMPVFKAECGAVQADCAESVYAASEMSAVGCGQVKQASLESACPMSGAKAINASAESTCTKAKVANAALEGESCDKAASCDGAAKAIQAAAESCEGKAACDQATGVVVDAAVESTECKQMKDGCEGDGEGDCCGGCAEATTASAEPAEAAAGE